MIETAHRTVRIAVCIITYRRPRGLRAALESLARQDLAAAGVDLRVVVVDNDPEGSAAAIVDAMRPEMPWPLVYAVESRRGIPFARNRCVALARPDAEWIAFIDDDEVTAPGWLAELVRVQREHDADIVTGPVVARFDGEVPGWARRGGFFDRHRFATGTLRDRAFTNNVLFRAQVFDDVKPNFDERMVMTGGSDAHFSRRASRGGFTIIYANEAEVFETFPVSRMTARWVFQRAYRIGTTNAFIERDMNGTFVAVRRVVPRALLRLLGGTCLALVGWVAGAHQAVRGLREVCNGAGLVVGLLGGRYDEYRSSHGD